MTATRVTAPVHLPGKAGDGDAVRVCVEIGQLLREAVWIGNVIGIMAGDEFRRTVGQPRIQSVHDAAMRDRDDEDARVGSRHVRQDARCLVAGSIVDDNDP